MNRPERGTRLGQLDTPKATSVAHHLEGILEDVKPLAPIEIGVTETLGLVLADEIVADDPLPMVSTALRAGYAVASADVASASEESPVTLQIAPSGSPVGGGLARPLAPGMALPAQADAIVAEEVARVEGDSVEVARPVEPGTHVRETGSDLRAGQRALRSGRRIRPGDVAVLAALGLPAARCHPQPRAVVLSTTADTPGAEAAPVRDSNGPMLLALLRQSGAVTFSAGVVENDRRGIIDAVDSNLGHADIFIVTGTSGLVVDVLDMLGDVHTTTVAMTPGRRQLYGRVRGVPVFGLAGHPAASFVSFELFVRPAIRRMQGRSDLLRPRITATLAQDVSTNPDIATYLRVRLKRTEEGWLAALAGSQDPHDLHSLAAADGLAEIPVGVETIRSGEKLAVLLLVEP
jgi:molybdopterin molybdotransferase